jgi:diacylglycerol O-acyltransferase
MAIRANRLSPLDASFLYFERPMQRLHVGCVALLDGALPFSAFVDTVGKRLAAIPRYRQRPVRPLLDLDWPRWEDDPRFDVRRHFRHVGVPPPGGPAELHEVVDSLFAAPLDDQHPLWENTLIDGLADGRTAILCKIHHSMIDGVSGTQVLEAMSDECPTRPTNGGAPPTATSPAPGRSSMLRTLSSPRALLGRARDALAAAGSLTPMVLEPISELPFNGQLTDARRIVWASFALDDFLAMRGADGCKVNDVVLAVITGAIRRYVQARGLKPEGMRVRTLVPVSVRRPEDHMSLGNLVSSMFPTLPIGIADPVERLRALAAEMRSLKEKGQAQASGLVMSLLGSMPAPVGALLGRLLPERAFINTVCTNVPGPRNVCHLAGRRIVEIHPMIPLFQNMGVEFAILSYAGQLSIAAAVDPTLVPDADTIPEHLAASADELRAALRPAPPRSIATFVAPSVPRVAGLMTTPPITIRPEDRLATAWRTMRARRIRHLPVVDGSGRLVGLVSHRDLLAASSSSIIASSEDDRVQLLTWARVGDVMETHLSVAHPDENASEAGERLIRHKIGCLPVVEGDAQLVGVVTEEDFLRWATTEMARAS